MTIAVAAVLMALTITGLAALAGPAPLLTGLGLTIAAAAPASFILWTALTRHTGPRHHPVLVSIIAGFGCVITLVGVYRFGDRHQWLLVLSLAALCLWMLWQRYIWRGRAS